MEILSAKELSRYLKINEKKIYQLVRSSTLPHTKIGGKIAFAKEIIDAWIAENTEREKHLYIAGSDDPLLRRIIDAYNKAEPSTIFYAPVGSINGLNLLKSGAANLACVHILDVERREYNVGYLDRYLSHHRYTVIHLYLREQGIYLPSDNPKKVRSLEDIAAKHVRFVNRNQGSGTRLLLDFLLHEKDIDSAQIKGYSKEVESHLQAGLSVLRSEADAAFGIRYVAHILNLHFIPLFKERFDLLIPEAYSQTAQVATFLARFDQGKLMKYAKEFAGYDLTTTGSILYPHA
ncbi:MAG TPA: helix-turn-helix transcriptional regulator [Syntrophorhabdales bacterium]|nr:helix-turn-helix transcriptional regulator [Syntrophorhabdales bacterium]